MLLSLQCLRAYVQLPASLTFSSFRLCPSSASAIASAKLANSTVNHKISAITNTYQDGSSVIPAILAMNNMVVKIARYIR